jgi:hypothetical protein
MDNDYPLDVDAIISVLGTAEVIVFRFLLFPQRLLVDPRADSDEGPLVRLVPPANSAEERFRALRRLRPRFAMPERVTVVYWPKYVDLLVATGVWAAIEQRVLAAGFADTARMTADVLCELRALERQELHNAIRGEGYRTLWERPAAP